MNRLTKIISCFLLIIGVSIAVWFLSSGIQLQPIRPTNVTGWKETPWGQGVTYVGQFVMEKGESTENADIGVKLVDISSEPCPFAAICSTAKAKATLKFYKPSDKTLICETTLESSSTSYDADRVCAGLPFTNIDVREINTKEGWAFISFFNVKDV